MGRCLAALPHCRLTNFLVFFYMAKYDSHAFEKCIWGEYKLYLVQKHFCAC